MSESGSPARSLAELLRELHAVETALTRFLPKLALAGASLQFRSLVATHLKETEGQLDRLDRLGKKIGHPLQGAEPPELSRIVAHVGEVMKREQEPLPKDRALAEAARKIEHYEIHAYQAAVGAARTSGNEEAAVILTKTLKEEEAADRLLEALAGEIAAGAIRQEEAPG